MHFELIEFVNLMDDPIGYSLDQIWRILLSIVE